MGACSVLCKAEPRERLTWNWIPEFIEFIQLAFQPRQAKGTLHVPGLVAVEAAYAALDKLTEGQPVCRLAKLSTN